MSDCRACDAGITFAHYCHNNKTKVTEVVSAQPEEKRIVLDIGEALKMLQSSPELATAMGELVAPLYAEQMAGLEEENVALRLRIAELESRLA